MSFVCEHDRICDSRRWPTGCGLCDDLTNPEDDWEFEFDYDTSLTIHRNGRLWDYDVRPIASEVDGHDWTEAYYKWKEQQND